MGQGFIAAIHEGHIGSGHLQHRDFAGTKRQRRAFFKLAADAQPLCRADDAIKADLIGKLCGNRINGAGQCFAHGDGAAVKTGIVARSPALDLDIFILHDAVGRAPFFQRGQKDNGLEA